MAPSVPKKAGDFKAEVTSSNTVGYQKLSLGEGFTMYAPTFVAIGGGSISIKDIVPSGDGIMGWGDVSLQIVGSDGNNSAEYAWFTKANSGLASDGWINDDVELVDVTINDGDSILVYSESEITLTCKGEVSLLEVPLNLEAGFSPIGNSKFQTIDIQELIPTGDDIMGWGDVSLQIVGADGNNSAEYAWFTKANSGLNVDAWINDDIEAVTVPFSAGDAFLIYTESDISITIPGVNLPAAGE